MMTKHFMDQTQPAIEKIKNTKRQINGLCGLRALVKLPTEVDISKAQWEAIERKLNESRETLIRYLELSNQNEGLVSNSGQFSKNMALRVTELQVRLPKAYAFFDTYLDILTQRHIPQIGKLLGGCDVLAWDALNQDHPALKIVSPPLVYLDRGFGASTIREGVLMPDKTPNPLPLIQIPYSKLFEKYNLTSVLHEVGHEAMVRLGLKNELPVVVSQGLAKSGAPKDISNYFRLWMSEIGPDFWTFCNSGQAAAGGIREILRFPKSMALHISWTDPHPPPYLRVLLNFEWCRQMWGKGIWDKWESEWDKCYPVNQFPSENRDLLIKMRFYLPLVSSILLQHRFVSLDKQTIPQLFEMDVLSPANLDRIARRITTTNKLILKGLRPCVQLAVFRLIKERCFLDEAKLNKLMTTWLIRLQESKNK